MVCASVTFEPGARTAWHTHPLGQTLIVVAGSGRAQRLGGPIEEIRPGDVIWIPPGEKSASAREHEHASYGETSPKRPYGREGGHWHGAAPTTALTHIAMQERLDGKTVEWMEKVSDEEYGR